VKNNWFQNPIVLLVALAIFAAWWSTPAYAEKKTVRIAYEEWSSEIASTNLVKAVIREKLGHLCIIKRMSVTDMYEAITNKTQDAMLAAWLPGQQSYYEKYKDGIESDSGMMTIMREKLIPAYGLEDFELIPGTEVSMTAELANAIKKRKWIVVLGWTPHWKFGRWKLKFLEDPKNVWGSEESIHTLARKGLKEDMPDVYKFLDNFNWSPDEMEQLLLWNEMGGNPYDNAKRWIRSNPKRVEAWLK
jgi:glycine betaine/proline transport system substrate-binding protein